MTSRLNDRRRLAAVVFLLVTIPALPSCGHKTETMKAPSRTEAAASRKAADESAASHMNTAGVPAPTLPSARPTRNDQSVAGIQASRAMRSNGRSAPEPQIADCYSIKPEDVPLAPMGEEPGYSPLTRSPGYYPPNDPEADAVQRGRRIAPKVDLPFTGGEGSPEKLALAILEGVRNGDSDALQTLRVTQKEFSEIMWREFPQSRPICNSDAETAYFYLDRECHSGIGLGLSHWGGQDLRLLGVTYSIGRAPYTNFTLYRGVQIHVILPNGEEGVVKFVRTFAERNGIWKVYAYKDKE